MLGSRYTIITTTTGSALLWAVALIIALTIDQPGLAIVFVLIGIAQTLSILAIACWHLCRSTWVFATLLGESTLTETSTHEVAALARR